LNTRKPLSGSKWIPLGLGLLAAGAATAILIAQRGSSEVLNREALDAARRLWQERGPKSYSLSVRVSGLQEGDHHIVVENGIVKSMTTGGAPVRESARDHWSVDGMFQFLDEELRRSERANTAEVILQAEFDSESGYPRRFLRHFVGQTRGIEWEVYSFEPSR
jgi:hypothetical protein